jgi:hypothetical protein
LAVTTIVCAFGFVCYRRNRKRKARNGHPGATINAKENRSHTEKNEAAVRGASGYRVFFLHELSGIPRTCELQTMANGHELAAGDFHGRRYELEGDPRP